MPSFSTEDYFKNFPLPTMREKQRHALKEISEAYSSGYKHILLEAPTGFGKSVAAIAVARTLGSSYICTSTKELQAQYHNDFPFIRTVKGKGNFPCLIKQDYLNTDKYQCKSCSKFPVSSCDHITVEYGPCMTDDFFRGSGCKYRAFAKHYEVVNRGTVNEDVVITQVAVDLYKKAYQDWTYLKNFNRVERAESVTWQPCAYFHQLNIGLRASHTILNYPAFLSLKAAHRVVEPRECVVLDECHSLEQEIVKYKGISVSKRRWKYYIPDFTLPDYKYELDQWVAFLEKLEEKMYELTGQKSLLFDIKRLRRLKQEKPPSQDTDVTVKMDPNGDAQGVEDDDPYGLSDYHDPKRREKLRKNKPAVMDIKRTVSQLEQKIVEAKAFISEDVPAKVSKEILIDALNDRDRLTRGLDSLFLDKKIWIVNDVKREGTEITRVELKPLDVAPYCDDLLSFCSKTLMMSATVLNHKAFCTSVGLKPDKVRFIQVGSDFPIANRRIFPLNVGWLNAQTIAQETTQKELAKMIDKIMTLHKDHKGIIHTTSYQQLKFIRANLSKENDGRLIETDPEVQREDVIQEHFKSVRPSVLISPSLYLGLDLKDDYSRFQIITKVPFPDMSDRWTNAKKNASEEWYMWQTALRLVQAYGRSIRSKEDWAKTYVLDTMFQTFVNKNRGMIPKWFVDAIGNHQIPSN